MYEGKFTKVPWGVVQTAMRWRSRDLSTKALAMSKDPSFCSTYLAKSESCNVSLSFHRDSSLCWTCRKVQIVCSLESVDALSQRRGAGNDVTKTLANSELLSHGRVHHASHRRRTALGFDAARPGH